MPTSDSELDQTLNAAASAASTWGLDATRRVGALRGIADALDGAVDDLVAIGQRETHLPEARLRGELRRTSFQLRFFADIVAAGEHQGVIVDHADPDWPMGAPRPDLRRMLIPIGPVCVFAASNFPFAFSVVGGDTASALAAGCPVVLKAHPGHPELSQHTYALAAGALRDAGAPDGTLTLIEGDEAGRDCLTDERIKAGAFTGSTRVGRILHDLAASRRDPIPFYGELGSVNPVVITPAAARERPEEIATGLIDSLTLGSGQFCTKPGLVFAPAGSPFAGYLTQAALPTVGEMLTRQMQESYDRATAERSNRADVDLLNRGAEESGAPTPALLAVSAKAFLADSEGLQAEIFGPAGLVIWYEDTAELLDALRHLEGQLTATVHGNSEEALVDELLPILASKAGRLVWNQWPTGVSVTHAQQHGGPYPATTAVGTTSVGAAAIERYLRPVAFQNFPRDLLPDALRDDSQEP